MTSNFKPCTLREMSPTEVAWVAGLLEGEGSFFARVAKQTRGRDKVQLRVQMGSTDEDVIDKIRAVTGVGKIQYLAVRPKALGTKPMWYWTVNVRADCLALISELYDHMGLRRRDQIDTALNALQADIAAYS